MCAQLTTSLWIVVLGRVLVGGLFILAGFSKLLLPHAEVVQLIRQYQVIPLWAAHLLAASLPWLEVGSGTALLIGFLTTPAALLIGAQLVSFSGLMLVVLGMGIAIEDCGCFGNLGLHETPLQVLIRDLIMLAMLLPILWRTQDGWGLDACFRTPEVPDDTP
jgi:putative oxidoreductase